MTKRKTEDVVEKKAAPKRVKASASAASAAAPADVDMPAAGAARKIAFCVGSGDMSQLGLGSEHQERKRFTTIPALKDKPAKALVCGALHNLVLLQDGSVQSWGCNDDGAIGRSTDEWLPEPVPALKGLTVTQIDAGDSHSVALTEDGIVYAWGTYKQNSGILGFSKSVEKQETPVVMTQLEDKKITQIAAGENHVLALTDSGKIYQWGDVRLGLRQSERVQKAKLNPTLVNIREKVTKVFACGYCSFALTAKNHVYGWGLNNYGQLGTGTFDEVKAPIRLPLIEALGEITEIAGALHHILILNTAGKVYAVGRGHYGRLGLGNQDDQKKPVQIPSLQWPNEKVASIAAGTAHSLAVTTKGRLFTWGYGDLLQLGNGTEQDEVAPYEVPNLKGVVDASGGAQHSLIIADERPKSDKSDKADAPAVAPPAANE